MLPGVGFEPTTYRLRGGGANDGFRRIFLVAAPSSEGLLTEPTAVAQPRRQEPLFMPLGRHLSADGPIGFKTRAFADFALFNHLISAGAAVAG